MVLRLVIEDMHEEVANPDAAIISRRHLNSSRVMTSTLTLTLTLTLTSILLES